MKTSDILNSISDITSRYMAAIVVLVTALSLIIPTSTLWVKTSWINYLLIVVMFGMGLILKTDDFALLIKRPKEIIIGALVQFTVMPLLAFCLIKFFNLDTALSVGIILVGTCPGGTASNVITYFAKGDIALSVCMTSVNTLLAPILTPLITYCLLKTTLNFDITGMFLSLVNIILLPIILGFIINKLFGKFTQKIIKALPLVSTLAICLIIASVVSHNAEKIYSCGMIILVIVILHNVLGYLFGFLIAKILKMTPEKTKAFSIEIGMQNSGLATSLAGTTFPNLAAATVPGAIFSVWHNISGALLAAFYRNWNFKK